MGMGKEGSFLWAKIFGRKAGRCSLSSVEVSEYEYVELYPHAPKQPHGVVLVGTLMLGFRHQVHTRNAQAYV
jgi:hypothetical protein